VSVLQTLQNAILEHTGFFEYRVNASKAAHEEQEETDSMVKLHYFTLIAIDPLWKILEDLGPLPRSESGELSSSIGTYVCVL
jgi:hypothetical protein